VRDAITGQYGEPATKHALVMSTAILIRVIVTVYQVTLAQSLMIVTTIACPLIECVHDGS